MSRKARLIIGFAFGETPYLHSSLFTLHSVVKRGFYMNKKIFAVFVFAVLFCANVFAAQEGLDIFNPEEAEKKTELEKTGFEEQYGDLTEFAYYGEKEKAKSSAKTAAKPSKPASAKAGAETKSPKADSAKTLEQAKGSSEKPLLADKFKFFKKSLDSASSNKEVSEFSKIVSKYWKKIKDFILNLPGIRHYRNSIYSKENYKKEVGKFKDEYKPHLHKDSQGVKMIKEGAKEF